MKPYKSLTTVIVASLVGCGGGGGDGGVDGAPSISAITAQSIIANGSSGTISFTVADDRTRARDLMVSVTSDNPALLSAAGLSLGGDGNGRSLAITPSTNQLGTAEVTISVTDGGGQQASTQFAVVVAPLPVSFRQFVRDVFDDSPLSEPRAINHLELVADDQAGDFDDLM